MKTQIESNSYNHKMVVLARESRGMGQSELSETTGISQGKLSKIENGLISIVREDISKISAALNYNESFFRRNGRIFGVGLSEYFHRKRQSVSQKILNKIYARIEIRRMEIAILLRSVDFEKVTIPIIDPQERDNDIEEIARMVRAYWHLPRGPIDNVVATLEDAGAIIVPFDFEGANVDAISIWPPDMPPLIFVNFDRPMDRIRFTICHELGHLVLHRTPSIDDADIEEQADRFASEFLMPSIEVAPMLRNVSLEKLATLKLYWKTSMAALLKKALDLNLITERQSRYFWMNMNKLGYRTMEPLELAPAQEKPTILDDIVIVHQTDLKYSMNDMSTALAISPQEFQGLYVRHASHLRLVR